MLAGPMRTTRPHRVKVQLSDQELRELKALARYERASIAQAIRIALRERKIGLVKPKAA